MNFIFKENNDDDTSRANIFYIQNDSSFNYTQIHVEQILNCSAIKTDIRKQTKSAKPQTASRIISEKQQ